MIPVQTLAYVVVQSTDLGRWREYGADVLGLMPVDAPDGGLHLKMDERAFRFAVVAGPEDRYLVSGWTVGNKVAFEETLAALGRAQVAVRPSSKSERAARHVKGLVSFDDPAGNHHEVSWGYTGRTSPFHSPAGVSGFKTGRLGLGHTVLPALPYEPTVAFFRDVLGFGLSDQIAVQMAPDAPPLQIHFLHAACGRHHSLALAGMPSPAGCVHVMVEANSMADVGRAHDRMQKAGIKLMATLGQHENDRMTSFYMMTPGNFPLEYGWGGTVVNPQTHQPTQTQQISVWGHDFSVGFR